MGIVRDFGVAIVIASQLLFAWHKIRTIKKGVNYSTFNGSRQLNKEEDINNGSMPIEIQ